MLRVVACLTDRHDLALVALAVLMLVVAVLALVLAASRAAGSGTPGARRLWATLAAISIGGGAWSTHFIAMLAYDSGLPTGFDPAPTLASALLAVGASLSGIWAWLRAPGATRRAVGGALVGGGIAGMHYLGMAAMRVPGHVVLAPDLVGLSVLLGAGLMAAAFVRLRPISSGRDRTVAAVLAIAAVAALHFVGMGAASVLPDPTVLVELDEMPHDRQAMLVAGMTIGWLVLGLGGALLHARILRRGAVAETGRLRGIAEATFEAVALCDTNWRVVDGNANLAGLLGVPREDLPGVLLAEALHTDMGEAAPLCLASLARRGGVCLARLNGTLPVEVRARVIDTGFGPRTVVALRDLRERVAAEARMQHLAHHDPLTDLPNRAWLCSLLDTALGRAAPGAGRLAVLALDLDRFQTVNDLHGHAAGDALLRQAAERLRAAVREGDLLARLGGDEFVVVQAPLSQPAGAVALAERLVAMLAHPFVLEDGTEVSVSASIGVALSPTDGTDAASLLQHAGTALARRKRAGRNGFAFFRPDLDAALRDRRALEQDLRFAIARGELALAYQPVAAAASRTVLGFEALLRWTHPARGPVRPDVFIPVAESSGAMLAIGEWVLRTAVTEAARWPIPLRVAVNVSPLQVQAAGFAELVEAVLVETGLAPARLELEVTESLFMADVERALEALRAVKRLGVRIALDDFGTGYSSLNTLRNFPFDKIKADRSFVGGLTTDPGARAIVRAVLGLGRGMGLPVVAEGVETEAQLAALVAEGCAEVQGWLLGKPLPIAAQAALTGMVPLAAAA